MELLQTVALLEDLPEKNLRRGSVGTIVYAYPTQEDFEVEFVDLNGRTYALETLNANQLMVLYHQPE